MSQTHSRSDDGTERTPGDIAVVEPYYLTEEAYQMGHNRFSESESTDEDEDVDQMSFLARFKESAKWIDTIAPELRAMAGYATAKRGGTYQQQRQVAAIHAGCEEDTPAEAELVSCEEVFDSLVKAFDMGAKDAVEGTHDPDSARFF